MARRVGVVFATALEAGPFLTRAGAVRLESDRRFPAYQASARPMVIAISGMGKVNAALAAAHLLQSHGAGEVWNIGLCGALIAGIPPGEIRRIREVREGDRDPTHPGVEANALPEEIGPSLPSARLVTVDLPVFELERRRKLSSWGELVDMEGAAVARACALWDVPCFLLKGVSDLADGEGKAHLLSNALRISEKLAEAALKED